MRNSTIKPISAKQRAKNRSWKAVTDDRTKRLDWLCEWCGTSGARTSSWDPLDGHHIEKRRNNNHFESNCFVCHRLCHRYIEDNNIKVYRGMKGVWAEGDERE